MRRPSHGGTQSSESSAASSIRDPLDERVEVDDVHEARAALVRVAGDPVDERRASGGASTATTWSGWTLAPKPTISSA